MEPPEITVDRVSCRFALPAGVLSVEEADAVAMETGHDAPNVEIHEDRDSGAVVVTVTRDTKAEAWVLAEQVRSALLGATSSRAVLSRRLLSARAALSEARADHAMLRAREAAQAQHVATEEAHVAELEALLAQAGEP